jgi:hypothetical protein
LKTRCDRILSRRRQTVLTVYNQFHCLKYIGAVMF